LSGRINEQKNLGQQWKRNGERPETNQPTNKNKGKPINHRRYRINSNPSIPELDENGEMFCLDELMTKGK
jgi:hypothetical protein